MLKSNIGTIKYCIKCIDFVNLKINMTNKRRQTTIILLRQSKSHRCLCCLKPKAFFPQVVSAYGKPGRAVQRLITVHPDNIIFYNVINVRNKRTRVNKLNRE